jgi:hypothetical protein
MTQYLLSLVLGMLVVLGGVVVGIFCLWQGVLIIGFTLPFTGRLLRMKVLTSRWPLIENLIGVAFLMSTLIAVWWLFLKYLGGFWVPFLIGHVITLIYGILSLGDSDQGTRYITQYRKYIREEFLKDGEDELPAERVQTLIDLEMMDK